MEFDDKTGKAIYNLNKAESWLVHEYFALCPRIKLQLDFMSYLDDTASNQARKELRQAVPQLKPENLPENLRTSLLRKISNRLDAQQCLEELNRAVVIMKDAIVASRVTGDTKLWSILMLRDDIFGDIELQHVDAVYEILHAQIDTSEFPGVQNIYKYNLTDAFCDQKGVLFQAVRPETIAAMETVARGPRMKDELNNVVSLLRTILKENLGVTTHIDPGLPLNAMPEMLGEEDDFDTLFSDLFPSEGEGNCLRMGHFCEVFKILDRINTFSHE
jgi:hypothetical protein